MHAAMIDLRIDWFRVLADLCHGGSSLYKLSMTTRIPRSSLQSYRDGVEPSHSVGSLLLIAWSVKTGRDPIEAPTMLERPIEGAEISATANTI
ncbi:MULTISPECIES: hypothetical protein [Burkholderia]|uniref:hypothetical protein n=1 Tax=Burkholderia TaxID=32008 RepID=UPI000B7A0B63|nr:MULTISPECIES: hypothetical protein [Burkholderia]MBY4723971.1 hypothetical protein [Burkholderia contaminans]MCI3970811.1 hypothetical protein [Burkholderia sp. HI4860]